MSESNNVKFVEANGKWLWKRYDEQGSVIFRSPEFDTERQAREDYNINGGQPQAPAPDVESQESVPTGTETTAPVAPTAPESADAGNTSPEGGLDAGSASSPDGIGTN
ncbi:MAG: hypothetical protein WCS89_01840 [Candidatus Paceibacterota bacterium]|jgi:hypothetical protein